MNNKKNLIFIIIVFLLMIGSGLGGYFLSQRLGSQKTTVEEPLTPLPSPTKKIFTKVKEDIFWLEAPEKIKNPDIFLKNFPDDTGIEDNSPSSVSTTYKVGEFVSGKYKGGDFFLVFADSMSPEGFYLYRVIQHNNKLILLKKHSDDIEGYLDQNKISVDDGYIIKELSPSPYIMGPEEGQTLKRADYQINEFFKEEKDAKIFFTDEKWGEVYSYGDGGFAIKKPDGTFTIYVLEIPFLGEDGIPRVVFNNGYINEKEYVAAEVGGCGFTNFAYVVSVKDGIDQENDLVQIGEVEKSGDPIFGFKNQNHPYLKKQYKDTYSVVEGKKVSYEKFVKSLPIFFWKDPFDRLIRFYQTKYGPAGECGKPVIYLYPREEIKVSVKLKLKGGLRYSDPPYREGWTVLANPNGVLKNIKDRKTYPYLFWEGKGAGFYSRPKRGFVVMRNDIHGFLIDKLRRFGFNKKETADFVEFWEPKMKDSPYYFVTFLTTKEMNQIAPLDIMPKPDTVIRVLMDFTPLKNPINVEEPIIRTPERKGFTVMEWGGVLR